MVLIGLDSYRLTLNGGHLLQKGKLTRCCMTAVPLLMRGYTVHMRSANDRSLVVSVYVADEGAYVTATRYGEPCSMPSWGEQFAIMLTNVTKKESFDD